MGEVNVWMGLNYEVIEKIYKYFSFWWLLEDIFIKLIGFCIFGVWF